MPVEPRTKLERYFPITSITGVTPTITGRSRNSGNTSGATSIESVRNRDSINLTLSKRFNLLGQINVKRLVIAAVERRELPNGVVEVTPNLVEFIVSNNMDAELQMTTLNTAGNNLGMVLALYSNQITTEKNQMLVDL